jgi:hypothetical protein
MQGSFQKIKYEMIGDEVAPSFFRVNEKSGLITVGESLRQGSETMFTVS